MSSNVKADGANPTTAPHKEITGNWQLDQELLGIARVAVRILSEQRPKYQDYRSVRESDDS